MNSRNYLLIGIGAVIAVALAMCLFAPTAKATNDPPNGGEQTVTGDWTIDADMSYTSTVIYLESGNLVITPGYTLSLTTTRIIFNSSSDYGYSLTVQAGGALVTASNSLITSNYTLIHYGTSVAGYVSMNNTLFQCGDLTVRDGGSLNMRTDNMFVESGKISVQSGGLLNMAASVRMIFNDTVDYKSSLNVQPGGSMMVEATSLISSNSSLVHYGFNVGGFASINSTNIMCGDLNVVAGGYLFMRSDTVWMESGNLTVGTASTLNLVTVKMMFNNAVDHGFSINVKAGGTMTSDTTCAFSTNQTQVRYDWNVAGTAYLNSTTIWAGKFTAQPGAYVALRSDTVYIERSDLTVQINSILNLSATKLLMNNTDEYGSKLDVQSGAALLAEAGSYIMSNRTFIHYDLLISGYASINSSTLQAGNTAVTGSLYMMSSTVWMEYGNLTVRSGGLLNLTANKWFFNHTCSGMYSFNIDAGGVLVSDAGSLITTNNTQYFYKFIIKGSAWVNNSRLAFMWGDNASWAGGVQIYSSSVTITNSTICMGMTGGISIFGCAPTIQSNIINGSGQCGMSPTYCFGIYIYNSNANISGNQVYDNTLKLTMSLMPTSTVTYSPLNTTTQHWFNDTMKMYTGTGNGGYFGNWARTQTQVLYARTTCFGTGVYIDSCSNLLLYNNTISRNGYVAYSSVKETVRVYEGYGDGCSTVLQYQGYGEHWCTYTNTTYYYLNTLYGVGVYVRSSTFNMILNTVDENGFETSQSVNTNEPTTGFYYAGTAVSMSGSHGLIQSNNIRNSPILINLVKSDPTILGNIVTCDFITGGTFTSQVIPWRIAYGIRCDPDSLPTITNNTISFIYKDTNTNIVFVGGTGVVNMDAAIAIELPTSVKNYILQGNTISFTSNGNGFTAAFGINITYKCSHVQLLDNFFSYTFTGTKTGNAPMSLVMVTLLSDNIVINNCTFKGPGATGNMPLTTGVTCNYGSEINITGCTFNGVHYGISITDFSTGYIGGCSMYNIITSGIWFEQTSSGTIVSTGISGIGRSLTVIKSTVTISLSTLNSYPEFYVDRGAVLEVLNTVHNRGAVTIMDDASYVNVSWPVKLQVQWAREDAPVPIEDADVLLRTLLGATIFSGKTDAAGRPFTSMWITDYQAHNQVVTMFNPHRLTVTKGRATSMDLYMLSQPLEITFNLLDNVAPELVVHTPLDNAQLSSTTVVVSGIASDIEAGLVDGRININVDNTGLMPLTVNQDGTWSQELKLGDGLHIIRIVAQDLVGNIIRSSVSFTVDSEPPNLRVFTPADGSSTTVRTVVVSGLSDDDAFVTVNGIVVQVRNRFFSTQVSLEDGLNTITVAASDPSGNTKTQMVDVSVDTLAPILDITSPKPDSYTSQDPVSLTGMTEANAIVKVNGELAQMDGSGFEVLVSVSEGANSITIVATDLAGNSITRTMTIYRDTTEPDLTVFAPREELWTNQSKLLINGMTEQGATVTINGQNVNVQNSVFTFYLNLQEGANKIALAAKDSAGNTRAITRTVFLDSRSPELLLTSPLDNVHQSTPVVPVLGSVDWGSEVYLNGERLPVSDFVFSTSLRFDSDGTKTIEIFTRDLAGNTAQITRTVHIDTVKPFISISYPLDNIKVDHRMLTVSGQTEPGATIVVNTETIVKVGDDGLFTVPVVLEEGLNRITVKAFDAAGNNDTSSVTITKTVAKAAAVADLSWMLHLCGLLIGIGIAFPIATYLITDSRRKARGNVLAEMEAAEQEKKEKEAMEARRAALPTVERIGKKRIKEPKKEEPPQEPPKMSTPPAAEAPAQPEVAKAGLKDKSGAEEVSPETTEQASKMETPKAPSAVEAAEAPKATSDAMLKDKGTEAEGAAEETELAEGVKKKPRQ